MTFENPEFLQENRLCKWVMFCDHEPLLSRHVWLVDTHNKITRLCANETGNITLLAKPTPSSPPARRHQIFYSVSFLCVINFLHSSCFLPFFVLFSFGWDFFAYSWKLPAYSEACLLTIYNFSFSFLQILLTIGVFLLTILAFYLQLELFCLQWESASNKGLKRL